MTVVVVVGGKAVAKQWSYVVGGAVELLYDCPRQSSIFMIRCAEHHPQGEGFGAMHLLDKFKYI